MRNKYVSGGGSGFPSFANVFERMAELGRSGIAGVRFGVLLLSSVEDFSTS
jgi:hypothetical protein